MKMYYLDWCVYKWKPWDGKLQMLGWSEPSFTMPPPYFKKQESSNQYTYQRIYE